MKERRVQWWLLPLGGTLLVGALAEVVAPALQAEPEDKLVVLAGHPRLGVCISDVTAERVAELKLAAETGVVIEEVEEESPAAKAGLQKNDVILAFVGERVRSAAQLRRLVQETPAGRKVTLEVSRGGQTRAVEVTLEERAYFRRGEIRLPRIEVPHIEMPEIQVFARGPRLGISGDELTPQLAEYFGVKQGKGVLVREVMTGSAAAKAGLKAGDVIVRVEDEAIGDVGDLRQALAKRESKEVTLGIVRDRREQTLKVEVEPPQRVSPRRSAQNEIYWIEDETELHRLAAEVQAEAAKIQKETQELQRHLHQELQKELREAQQLLQQKWRQEWQQRQRQLQEEMKELRRELRTGEVI